MGGLCGWVEYGRGDRGDSGELFGDWGGGKADEAGDRDGM